jgi:hypothetical protein
MPAIMPAHGTIGVLLQPRHALDCRNGRMQYQQLQFDFATHDASRPPRRYVPQTTIGLARSDAVKPNTSKTTEYGALTFSLRNLAARQSSFAKWTIFAARFRKNLTEPFMDRSPFAKQPVTSSRRRQRDFIEEAVYAGT